MADTREPQKLLQNGLSLLLPDTDLLYNIFVPKVVPKSTLKHQKSISHIRKS